MAGIMDAFGFAQQQDQALTQQALGINQQAQGLGEQIIAAAAQRAEQEQAAQRQKLEAELAAQTAGRKVAESVGANPDAQNFALATLGEEFMRTFQQARQVQDEVVRKQSVGFFDNPIQYLVNQATVGGDINKYNALATKANGTLSAMNAINTTVQTSVAAQRSISETLTRDSIKAQLDSTALAAKIQGLELEQKNLSFDMDSIKLLMANNDRTLQRAQQINQIQVQQQQLAISQGHLALAQREASERAQARAAKLAEDQEEKAGWDEAVRIYNIGAGIQGFAPQTPDQLRNAIKYQGDVGRKKFEQFYSAGLIAAGTGNKIIGGATPGESALAIMKNNSPLNEGMEPTKGYLTQVWQKAVTSMAAAGTKPTEQGVVQATNQLVEKQTKVMMQDVTKNPYGTNIYAAPDLRTLMQLPSVKGSKFAQTVLATQVAGGAVQTNPDVLIDAGLEAIKSGTLTPNEFTAGLTNLFAEAKNWNNATKNFKAVNIPLQSTFNAQVYTGSRLPIGRHEVVDLSNASQVNNFLMRRITKQRQGVVGTDELNMYLPQ